MITPEIIERINILAKKQRENTLTPEEKAEQTALRRLYIDNIKNQIRVQLDPVKEDHDKNCSCGCHHEH